MKLVCIADTHMYQPSVPDGDVLIHAGDHTNAGTGEELRAALDWLASLPHQTKIAIAGNHDLICERNPLVAEPMFKDHGIIYLLDQEVTVHGLRIYGSPWQPKFFGAFNLPRGYLGVKWDKIPEGIDMLITHGPPHRILDRRNSDNEYVGCEELRSRVIEVGPKYHVFGHIHEGYGTYDYAGTTFLNVSICNMAWPMSPANPPMVLEVTP